MKLSEKILKLRKQNGLSQEELAAKLNVVRQTISKWEQGLSVPDSDMLIAISDALGTPVSILLGENIVTPTADDLKIISEKLEVINYQLAQRKASSKKSLYAVLVSICAIIGLIFVALLILDSPYLEWDYSNPEYAVVGVLFHAFEWLFVRFAPIILVITIAIYIFMRRKH